MHTHRFLRLLVPRPHFDLPTYSVAFSKLIAFLFFFSWRFCATAEDDERSAGRVKQGSSLSASAVDKEAVSLSDVGIDLLIGFLEQQWKKRGGQPALLAAPAPDPTVSTTTQPATVDIKTLPGVSVLGSSSNELLTQ